MAEKKDDNAWLADTWWKKAIYWLGWYYVYVFVTGFLTGFLGL